MTFHRKFMYLVRRPQKPIILFLIIVFLYGLLQSFGKLQNSTKVYLENDEYRKVVARSQSWVQQNQNNDIEVDFLQNVVPLSRQQPRLIKILLKGTNDSDALKTDSDECCEQNYHPEADTEFNTFEIMKHVVASIGQTSNAPAREKPNVPKLQVFFLPMTHVDPGWLKTFDEYCPSTNAILDNMHQFLKEHPKMRFMWCEISFFEVWWSKVNETVKSDIKKMISNGQLEIASGSWVMSDEANPYFGSSVDNIIEGQQFVLNELGVKPTVIWSNDPFGYGPTIPYLFKKTGIRRAVINRIHHKIKQYLQSKRAIPFIWKQHFDSSNKSDVLTQVLPYTHYDILNSCGPARSVCCQFDFKRMTHFSCPGSKPVPITNENKAAKAALLKQQLVTMSKLYESNVLLVVWGDDFRYDMLQEWYQHYDNLMPLFEQLNTENDIEVRFGTFNDYFNALEKFYASKSLKPATVSGDFFPYQCALGDYWTGYYTTRPFFKKLERQLHAMIYAADLMMLSSAPVLSDSVRLGNQKLLITSRRNLALFQHHDAITGTSKKHVMQDYATRLHSSMVAVNEVFEKTLNLVFNSSFQMNEQSKRYDEMWSETLINLTSGDKMFVNVWNSLTYEHKAVITLHISTANLVVKQNEQQILSQIEPYFDFNKGKYTDDFQLVFAVKLQALSNNLYSIEYSESPSELSQIYFVSPETESAFKPQFSKVFVAKPISADNFRIETNRLQTTHDLNTGFLESFNVNSTPNIKLVQDFVVHEHDSGGAYIMRFTGHYYQISTKNLYRYFFKGPVRQRIFIHTDMLQQWISATVGNDVEDEFLNVDLRIDIRQFCDLQLVTTFNTSLDPLTTQAFTDSNGMQLIKREYHSTLDAAANYYPMPTVFMLQDQNTRLSIVSNLEHGARVYGSTGAEIMLDRVMCRDDGKGLGSDTDSIPNDILPVAMEFTIVVESMANSTLPVHYAYNTPYVHRALQERLYPPIITVSKGTLQNLKQSSLSLPFDVQIVSSRSLPQNANRQLLVLHRLGTDCSSAKKLNSSALSLEAALKQYLKSMNITKVQKTNLSGTDTNVPIVGVNDLEIHIEPMDFLALILYSD